MLIDLHTHSTCSDGTDAPAELIAKAANTGLDVVALTDHDTTSGWAEAQAAAAEHGIELVRGIELSTRNGTQSQHLLAYEPDPTDTVLVDLLAKSAQSREGRIPAILAKFSEAGIDLDPQLVATFAGTGSVGRPHIADALVASGVCENRAEAFDRFLVPGSPMYVKRFTPDIVEAITIVRAAGGVPVIAHPWGRKTHVSEERFAELANAGLAGIEVDHQEHDDTARDALRAIAANLGLLVTGSSDHHGAGKVNHELACNTTSEDDYAQLRSMMLLGA